MKNLIKIITLVLLILSMAFSMFACAKDAGDDSSNPQPEVPSEIVAGDDSSNPPPEEPSEIVASTKTQLETAFSSLQEGQKIKLKENCTFGKIVVPTLSVPIHIIAESGVYMDGLEIGTNIKNFTIENVTFQNGRIDIDGGENITIKDCAFKNKTQILNEKADNEVKNLVIDGCEFINIIDNTGALLSAIEIHHYNNFTVKNCTFDNIEYNAMQIGHQTAKGTLLIDNNSFEDVGSRVIYLVTTVADGTYTIKDNKFYDNLDCLLQQGESDPDGIRKGTGVYINVGGEGNAKIEKNYWEEIPDHDNKYITVAKTTYDKTNQEIISD